MEAEKLRELKSVDDINTFFELNDLSDMSDEEEINEYITELSSLGKAYRDVHTELSAGLGDASYSEKYPKQQEFRENVNLKIQDAKRLLRQVKRGKSKTTEKQNDFLSEIKFLTQRSDDFSDKVQANSSSDMDELRHDIGSLEMN